jgi:protein-tyrosine phosphatase
VSAMRYGLLFLVLGSSIAALGAVAGGAAWVLSWPALSFCLVGVAYLARRPAMLGKRPDGTIAAWSLPLLGPYFLLAWGIWHAERLRGRADAANEVAPALWVGRRPLSHELPAGVRRVVDLTAEFPAAIEVRRRAGYLCVPLLDGTALEIRTLRALLDRLRGEEGILLHCAAGRGRSAMVAAALLIERGLADDVEHAEAMLRQRRPGIRLNAAQRRLLYAMSARAADKS